MNSGCPSSNDGQYTEVESADQESTKPQQVESVNCGEHNLTAVDCFGEDLAELTTKNIEGREFATLDDAENWYRMYATALGFGTRLQRVTRGIGGRITRRRLVCNKEGKREAKWLEKEDRVRKAKRETRCNCLAACCIHFRRESRTYIITEFKTEHTHDLAMHVRSNRPVTKEGKGHLRDIHTCSISTSTADDYTAEGSGGNDLVGYAEKNVLNTVGAERRAKLANQQGDEGAPSVEVSDITMPPWSINLVGFEDDFRCDHIDIPQSVTYSYVSLPPHVKAVSANTASTLLRQIAGLTSIATEQSLKARDEVVRLKRDSLLQEQALMTKEAEVETLKRELAECRRELELVKSSDNVRNKTIEEAGGNPRNLSICTRGQFQEGAADIRHLFPLGSTNNGFSSYRGTEFDTRKRLRR